MLIPIEISARHIHLSQTELDILFGAGFQLHKKQELSQTGEFAAEESVTIIGEKRELEVRIVGPVRQKTQVELSLSDARNIGVATALRLSGDLDETPGVILKGPAGQVALREGVIIAKRHLHINIEDAKKLNLANQEIIKIRISGERGGIIDNIIVRSGNNFRLALHLDTDEANAFGIDKDNNTGELIRE